MLSPPSLPPPLGGGENGVTNTLPLLTHDTTAFQWKKCPSREWYSNFYSYFVKLFCESSKGRLRASADLPLRLDESQSRSGRDDEEESKSLPQPGLETSVSRKFSLFDDAVLDCDAT
jgi:hypothetical protein